MSSDSPPNRPPRVFISYSHDSETHAERVLELANRLRSDHIDAWIDQYETAPARGWPLWMEDQVGETAGRPESSKEPAGPQHRL